MDHTATAPSSPMIVSSTSHCRAEVTANARSSSSALDRRFSAFWRYRIMTSRRAGSQTAGAAGAGIATGTGRMGSRSVQSAASRRAR